MRYFIFIVAVLFFAGCTKLGPDFKKPDPIEYPKNIPQQSNVTQEELATWWEMFHDKTLEKLVKTGYKNNLDIKQAGLRILQARAALGVTQGYYYPQQQTLSAHAMSSYAKNHNINSAGINFDIGWEIDFWGKYARGVEGAEAALYLNVASYRGIMSSVVAEIARVYINYKTTQERIVYAKRNIAIGERVAKMTEVQFNSGNVSELDMQQARTQLYTTKAKLPSLKLSLQKSINALALLLAVPNTEIEKMLEQDSPVQNSSDYLEMKTSVIALSEKNKDALELKVIPTASFLPEKKISIELLQKRPDVQVAEYKARVQSAKIGSTKALLYPSFVLFGSVGINANDALGDWTSFSDGLGVGAGPALSWNIFQYGRIKNRVRIEDARFQEALYGYNKTLLQALNELSNAINAYMYTQEQLKENKKALHATVRAFNLSARQYNDGLVSYQRLLSTVEKLTMTQDLYAQIKGSVAVDAVLIYKALGGGWQGSDSQDYLDEQTKKQLKSRGVDWGEYLE